VFCAVQANAAFFVIGVLTYNLDLGFRDVALGMEFERAQVQTCADGCFRRQARSSAMAGKVS
jgi:hypothetical protein